jgi:hypothetical protein
LLILDTGHIPLALFIVIVIAFFPAALLVPPSVHSGHKQEKTVFQLRIPKIQKKRADNQCASKENLPTS